MIVMLRNLKSTNKNGKKEVHVFAKSDTDGDETLRFTIVGVKRSKTATFKANKGMTVSVEHTASGTGMVKVNADGSTEEMELALDVDRQEDKGKGT